MKSRRRLICISGSQKAWELEAGGTLEVGVGGMKTRTPLKVFVRNSETLGSFPFPPPTRCLHGLTVNNTYVNKTICRLDINMSKSYNVHYIIKMEKKCV